MRTSLPFILPLLLAATSVLAQNPAPAQRSEPVNYSGIYPHLAYWNKEGECGTGAVVPWANKLWVITYGPHLPNGSSDKLYEIDGALSKTTRPESVGGTPANRMIHRESNQLFIGPYIIDGEGAVRVIKPAQMPGRLTGNARHLFDPAGKIYYATMEEGFYEVDVKTLAVTELFKDANSLPNHAGPLLPGYHGKGLYSGQGRLVYANNGELSAEAQAHPEIESGVLASWDGKAGWQVVRRNQFTDVTGPGGIEGNAHPATDPLWSIGWDNRSLILMLLEEGQWHTFRLPKASHCYDGAHGWNTEWPRIRDIGEDSLLMTMHGMFWKFPKTFSLANSAGIAPRSTYLKVIGDFCRWNDRLVFGCDDSAKSEFLNKNKAKGTLAAPSISNSNLWFAAPELLDQLGPARGQGAVWLNEAVRAHTTSDAFLFSGFDRRAAYFAHDAETPVTFSLEVDRAGNGRFEKLRDITVPAHGVSWSEFGPDEKGAWVRVVASGDCAKATAFFSFANADSRTAKPDAIFAGLAPANAASYSAALVRSGGDDVPTLAVVSASVTDGKAAEPVLYHMSADMKLRRVENPEGLDRSEKMAAIPAGVLQADEASLIFVDGKGRRFRLPRGGAEAVANEDAENAVPIRVSREVCTERDLFHAGNTFYELPAENAGGFGKVRPIATHPFHIVDYCSWRGLLILSGVDTKTPAGAHIVRSEDGQCALWLGAADDLWKLGRATGHGGPWKASVLKAGQPSDAYLFDGFDRKTLVLSHESPTPVSFELEADLEGTGHWRSLRQFIVAPGQRLSFEFPAAQTARWIRLTPSADCTASAQLRYE